jgi:prepilin-type N-terminal cleavage/methylation domain-containing protein
MGKRQSGRAGFTLVEVIVSMTIFTMVISGGLTGVRQGFELVDSSRHRTRVSQLLQSEIESLRTLSWEEIEALPASATIDIDTQFETSAHDTYTVKRAIIAEEDDLARVELSVTYTTQSQKAVTLKCLTYFTQGGVNDYYYRTI